MEIPQRLLSLICVAFLASPLAAAQSGLSDGPEEGEPSAVASLDDSETGMAADLSGCNGRCPSRCVCCECEPAAPWSLPQPRSMQQLGIKMGGWLQQGITLNPDNPSDHFNGPVATNDWDDEYQMNQLWFFLDRPANTGGCGFAMGGHVDVIFGTDWRFGINNGLETQINGFDYQRYGLVIPQMYLEVAYNDLSVKLGHFAGILDYEAVPAVANPFYSHSYSYGYTVPLLVTGALGEYKLGKQLALQAGLHRGWLMYEDTNDTLDFMGGVKWNSANQRTKIAYAISTGPQDPPADFNHVPGDQNRFVYSLVIQQKIGEKLQYVAVQNLGTERNAPTMGNTAEWYGLNQYFLYTLNSAWNANLRVEWLRDDDGVRIAGPGNIPGVYAWSGGGLAGNFYGITGGLSWRPNGNLVVRPECRWDWYDGEAGPRGLPFDGGLKDHQFTFGLDAIITF